MGFKENLKSIRKERGITQARLSEITGIDRASLSHYETGLYEPDIKKIEALARALNVSVADFFASGYRDSLRFVPLIGLASCGTPQEYALDGYDPVPVDTSIYRPGMYAVEAEGDSMSPKINHGDIVYCDPNMQVENGNIVHYQYGEESGIKKYKINEAGTVVSLIPINTDYDPIIITDYENVGLRMARVVGSFDRDY